MGPDGTLNFDVYLRTAISAEANGWANFGYVKMPDYRWGIFLAGQDPNRVIAYGDNKGKPVWQEVPGELRSTLRRLIVTQGDTEPALGRAAAPSGQDRAFALRPAQPLPDQLSRKAGICGPWSTCCTPISAATAARRPRRCWSAIRATPTSRASWAPSTRRRRTGCPSSCSPISPTATASTSSRRWPNRASIRWRAPAASC